MTIFYKSGACTIALVSACIFTPAALAADDEFTIKVFGRAMFDYNAVNADQGNGDWNATELRRARIGASGQYGSNVKYKLEFNTDSGGEVEVTDGWVQWAPTGGKWNIKAGQFKTPNSLDEMTSSRFISTIERAAFTDAFQLDRRVGISVNTSGDNYTFSAGVFGDNLTQISDQESHAIAARGTYNPVKTDETIVHVGASVRYRDQGEGQGDIRYRQRPYAHIPGRVLSTGSIAQSDTFIGLEAAAIHKQLWLSGEYGMTNANCAACSDDPSLNGLYLEAGMFFGGQKGYKGGKFDRQKVHNPVTSGGYGAFSVVARYDTIDLADDSVNGGDYDSFILGADWYPVKNVRLGVNYFNVDANLGTSTSGLDSDFAALIGSVPGVKVDGIAARAQFDF